MSQVLKTADFGFLYCVRSGLTCHPVSSSRHEVASLLILPQVYLVLQDLSAQTNKQGHLFRNRLHLVGFFRGSKKVVLTVAEEK